MKIALIGYGKMGHMIEDIARQRGHEIVSIIDVNNQDDFDSPEFASADVAIEFTNPTAAYGNYLKAFSHGVKVVSGALCVRWLVGIKGKVKHKIWDNPPLVTIFYLPRQHFYLIIYIEGGC